MHLTTSNRAELLVEQLGAVLAEPAGGPFSADLVVVHSPGMGVWLTQQLARRLGICAQVAFPYPTQLIPEVVRRILGARAAGVERWSHASLKWAILAELPLRLHEDVFADVRGYVTHTHDETPILGHGVPAGQPVDALRLLQLSDRLARVFAGYVYYRPEMVAAWQRGDRAWGDAAPETQLERWQAELWRAVRARLGAPHVAELFAEVVAALHTPGRSASQAQLSLDLGGAAVHAEASAHGLPPRVCVFGVSSLPRLQLEYFAALSRVVPVHLFVLSPSREFFADIRAPRELARRLRASARTAAEEYLEGGNPLLASLGRLGRDFQQAMLDAELPIGGGTEAFVDPLEAAAPKALAVIQSDILNLRHRSARTRSARAVDPLPWRAGDTSIAIHACHGPMREVEVLHDLLLERFCLDPSLTPADVIVLCPDLDTYGPLIEAVFDRVADDRQIPFRVADRRLRRDSLVAEAFLAMLRLSASRMSASEVLEVVSMPAIYERFGITADDLPAVVRWVRETGIRWGIDGAHRVTHGQPPYDENTWTFGLRRALLGVAMPGAGLRMFGGMLPYDEIEGGDAELLGRLVSLCEALFGVAALADTMETLPAWRDRLAALLAATVVETGENAWEHEQIRRLLDEAADHGGAGGAEGLRFPLAVVSSLLTSTLTEARSPHGFGSGAVTFCEMVPMRTVPFRVVAMLGMDERGFPRAAQRFGFDLVAQSPMPGDRSLRDDDRYLFLEALLSARDALLILYTGQSIRDNAALPPSVVVSELLDACADAFFIEGAEGADGEGGAGVVAEIVTRQPLQPFSDRYFRADEPRLFTYAREYGTGVQEHRLVRREERPFVSRRVAAGAPPEAIPLDDLVRFYRHPLRWFFQRTLKIRFPEDDDPLLDREPIVLSRLEASAYAGALLERNVRGERGADARAPALRGGQSPLGSPGDVQFASSWEAVDALGDAVRENRGGFAGTPIEIDCSVAGVAIVGRLTRFGARLVEHRYARVQADHELGCWVRHLAACAASPAIEESILIGRPSTHSEAVRKGSRGLDVQTLRFRRPDDPTALLGALVRRFRDGQAEPLLLFPRTSLAYVEQRGHVNDYELRRVWEPFGIPGEAASPYVRALLGAAKPWALAGDDKERVLGALPSAPDLNFGALAREIFGPLEAHRDVLCR